MSRDEVKKILMVIANTYPNFKPLDMKITIDLWTKLLADMTYQQIENALIAYIRSDASGFAPTIGQLLAKVQIVRTDELSEMEAWSLVSHAIRNGTYGAEEEFKKLPKDVQRCVTPELIRQWAKTDTKSVENVIQSNFLRTYRNVIARRKEVEMIPDSIKAGLIQKDRVLISGE